MHLKLFCWTAVFVSLSLQNVNCTLSFNDSHAAQPASLNSQVKKELAALEEQLAPLLVQYQGERARLEEIRSLQVCSFVLSRICGVHLSRFSEHSGWITGLIHH